MSGLRQRRRLAAALLLGAAVWLGVAAPQEPADEPDSAESRVIVLTVRGAIGPATSYYIQQGIERAEEVDAELVVLELDTPGGLDSAMRDIIQAILGSDVPFATYVYPEGARAASAGTYILYASHVAAMAPATNLGAATPVAIGGGGSSPLPGGAPQQPGGGDDGDSGGSAASNGDDDTGVPAAASDDGASDSDGRTGGSARDEVPTPSTASERKAINDAVAYIRSLAQRRDRNADWAERAVRSAESLSAVTAVELNVVDLIAADLTDLFRELDGREIDGTTLSLPAGATQIERFEADWRMELLSVISNPTLAYILLLVGIYGLIFEGYNPGAIVPGVVGAISLLLAFFAFQILPINYAGLALIALGVILMLAEFFVPSFGALGIGGIAAFVFGSLILIDTDVPGFSIALPLITSIAVTGALALLGTVWLALKARDRKPVSGIEQMLGMEAVALEDFEREGAVWVHGERWWAISREPVAKGESLTVIAIHGLTLRVRPADTND